MQVFLESAQYARDFVGGKEEMNGNKRFRFKEVTIECIQQIREKYLFSILECLCLTISPLTFSQ